MSLSGVSGGNEGPPNPLSNSWGDHQDAAPISKSITANGADFSPTKPHLQRHSRWTVKNRHYWLSSSQPSTIFHPTSPPDSFVISKPNAKDVDFQRNAKAGGPLKCRDIRCKDDSAVKRQQSNGSQYNDHRHSASSSEDVKAKKRRSARSSGTVSDSITHKGTNTIGLKMNNRTRLGAATPAPKAPVFKQPNLLHPPPPPSYVSPERARKIEIEQFYRNYDVMDGLVTAIVLGGFFAFVCLLVVYKTKCKPMWKNRRKRLTNTPATASMGEMSGLDDNKDAMTPDGKEHSCGDQDDCGFQCHQEDDIPDCLDEFECIPLQTVCNEEDDDDIYFLDEFGNYVFPVSTPTIGVNSCSCPPSAEALDSDPSRRVSQVITACFNLIISSH